MVYILGNNLLLICQLCIDYDCPAKFGDDGYEYKTFKKNVFANVKHLKDIVGDASKCRDACDTEKGDTCDFFMYHYRTRRCIMWHFVRPSRTLQVGLTKDAIFCLKKGTYV